MTTELLNVTRDQMAFKQFTAGVDRIRRLEVEVEAAFEELQRGIDACHAERLEVMVRLSKPVDAAWAAYKNRGYAERADG